MFFHFLFDKYFCSYGKYDYNHMINNVFIAIWFKCKKTCAKNSIGYNAFQLQIETCCNL